MSEKTLVEQLREASLCDVTLYAALHGHTCLKESCSHCCLGGSIADRIEAEYTPNSEIEAKYMPYPLDADGVPCKKGDLVQDFDKPGFAEKPVKVIGISDKSVFYKADDGSIKAHVASNMHHVEPPKQLTKEDIDVMARMGHKEYWKCVDCSCFECPSAIEEKLPSNYYHTKDCINAQKLDLLRLERERVAGEQQ